MNKTKPKSSRWKRVMGKVFIGFSMIVVGLLVAGFAFESIASQKALSQYPPPGKMIDVGGHSLHMQQYGNAGPTIVLETGSGASSISWEDLPSELSSYGTVVAYDRGGYAWSEKPSTERSGENIVRELHTALKKTGLEDPYILVGHSLGGMYNRLFAKMYPEDVAGMVLLDARPENYSIETDFILEEAGIDPLLLGSPSKEMMVLLKQTGILRLMGEDLFQDTPKIHRHRAMNVEGRPKYFIAKQEELEHLTDLEKNIRNHSLGSIPITIVTHGIPIDASMFGISEEHNKFMEEKWQEQQREMRGLSTNVRFVIAEKSGHLVSKDQPEVVEDAVEELITRVEKQQNK